MFPECRAIHPRSSHAWARHRKREAKVQQRKGRRLRLLSSPKCDFHKFMGAELKRRGRAGSVLKV